MKVTLSWLHQYVDFDGSAEELAERLTMLGLEVEGIHKIQGEFEGVVVAQVLTRDPHPNADKLSVCRVTDGRDERQIVCGAQNFQAGDKVPLVTPGATLPTPAGEKPFVIKVSKIRGVESHGMLCSPRELGLSDDAAGLMILPPDARVGQPFARHLGRPGGDVMLDLEITPNRPDLNSVLGIAREIAAVTGNRLRRPEVAADSGQGRPSPVDALVAVRLDAPDLCPRYTARVVRGVQVGPSPEWLRQLLERVGLRSINNIVDVTNYVMLETGQPLHAFDYHLIHRDPGGLPTLVVRRAQLGEKFTTLDGQEHELTADTLMIADEARGIALAGVMGGQNTEIHGQTVDVLLESAWFLPAAIRRTAKRLGLRTDASYRFERGADPGVTDWASLRAARLMVELAGGEVVEGMVDAYPQPFVPRQITLRPRKVSELLGVEVPGADIESSLSLLGLRASSRKPRAVDQVSAESEPQTWIIPTWRPDLKRETDLIEEVVRLYGVDKVPATPPRGALGANAFDALHDQLAETRRLLTGLGLDEAQGQTLISETSARRVTDQLVPLSNPLSADMSVLRPSLLPGLLDSLRHNLARQNTDVALFEIGRVFAPGNGGVHEERRVALALTGRRSPTFWQGADRDAKFGVHDLKGLLDEFLEQLGLRAMAYRRRDAATPFFAESAVMALGGKVALGELGQLQPALARNYDLRDPVFLAELNLDELLRRRIPVRSYKPVPPTPAVRRDVAMLVADTVTHDAVLAAVRQARAPHLENIELFDVFRGKNVPDGQKSVAYAFTYRNPDRTLTDTEVNAAHEKIVASLQSALRASLRE